ncbi:DUF4176 domain-containing protein [Streptococcus iniae]|uniref:DUF4176 domain-containing protein n=1 Tax=Streptococcus iniae TaxID=1346 RepID=UPI001C7D6095
MGLDLNNLYYFNKENIDRVVFEGYCDDDEIRYRELYNNWLDSNDGEFQKGQVIN